MAIAPAGATRATARAGVPHTRASLRDRLGLSELSMGMTGDLEVALAEGATLVRVGSGLFGPRPSTGRGATLGFTTGRWRTHGIDVAQGDALPGARPRRGVRRLRCHRRAPAPGAPRPVVPPLRRRGSTTPSRRARCARCRRRPTTRDGHATGRERARPCPGSSPTDGRSSSSARATERSGERSARPPGRPSASASGERRRPRARRRHRGAPAAVGGRLEAVRGRADARSTTHRRWPTSSR